MNEIADRLEYLRSQIRAECISYGEIAELESMAGHIEPGDVELLQWANVPEFMTVRFHPQAWQNDYAVPVDPEGPTEWEPSSIYVRDLLARYGRVALEASTYESDELRHDPAAPEWVRNWSGPFYCEVLGE